MGAGSFTCRLGTQWVCEWNSVWSFNIPTVGASMCSGLRTTGAWVANLASWNQPLEQVCSHGKLQNTHRCSRLHPLLWGKMQVAVQKWFSQERVTQPVRVNSHRVRSGWGASGEAGNKGIAIPQAGAQASAKDARGGSGVPLADLILKAWLGQGRAKGAKAGGKFWDLRSGALLPPWWASAVWKYRKEIGWLMRKHLRGEGPVWCRGPPPRRLCYKALYTAATLSGEERREVGGPHVWCPSSFRDL